MPYIDKTYFTANSDISISDEELAILSSRASDIINTLTRDLQGIEFNALPLAIQDKVKKATLAQVEALYLAGGTESLAGGEVASATIGKFSYSGGVNESNIPISPMISFYLASTGLLYRGLC